MVLIPDDVAVADIRPLALEQLSGRGDQLKPARLQRLSPPPTSNLMLGNNRAGIDSGINIVDGDPLGGIIKPAPEVRVCPTVPRQQGDVDVDDAVFVLLKDITLHDLAMAKRDNEINGLAGLRDQDHPISCLLEGALQHMGIGRKDEDVHLNFPQWTRLAV